ncbi:MAG: glycyl-radical enzyme activating protein [Deltaproteobacteria bacterium]|nr:glycyl-radical enzyme activating protein [Deltaproteobacteria bacterium]
MSTERYGFVFNIQHFSIHDGPGIRTVIFLKGCPLRCLWCCNPESQNFQPNLGLRLSHCNGCGECIPACTKKALSLEDKTGTLEIDRSLCDGCGECIDVCPREALTIYGQKMTAEEVVEEISKDAPFYKRSGGGMTISGGEPLMQPGFTLSILRSCKEKGIHTAMETSGYGDPRSLSDIMNNVDLFLFDLKVMDGQKHMALTGKNNSRIMENARLISEAGCNVQPRMPLIPTINADLNNITSTAEFLHSVGWSAIELMPYHQFGKSKYEALGKTYILTEILSPKQEDLDHICTLFKDRGIECRASE